MAVVYRNQTIGLNAQRFRNVPQNSERRQRALPARSLRSELRWARSAGRLVVIA